MEGVAERQGHTGDHEARTEPRERVPSAKLHGERNPPKRQQRQAYRRLSMERQPAGKDTAQGAEANQEQHAEHRGIPPEPLSADLFCCPA
jgi:hypothetical protein